MTRPQARDVLQAALVSGSAASVLSTVVLAWRGSHDGRDAAGPMNGPSQWIWGSQAPYARGFSVRHTVLGYAIHHLASIFWALAFETVRSRRRDPMPAIAAAVGTSATASFIDFHCTPRRLEPGFDKRLTRTSLALVYGAFAAGLAIAAIAAGRPGR